MAKIETLRKQAEKLSLEEGQDYTVETYTVRTTGVKVQVLKLTPEGVLRRDTIKHELFDSQAVAHWQIPLRTQVEQLREGDVVAMDGLLAISLIRRRTGGYVCSLIDNFATLQQEAYRARVQHIDQEKGQVRLLFDHWPGEYIQREYFVEKPNLISVNEPVSIGPECVIEARVLSDGLPHEDLMGWLKNVVKRNLLGTR